jgi:hypothetical protein
VSALFGFLAARLRCLGLFVEGDGDGLLSARHHRAALATVQLTSFVFGHRSLHGFLPLGRSLGHGPSASAGVFPAAMASIRSTSVIRTVRSAVIWLRSISETTQKRKASAFWERRPCKACGLDQAATGAQPPRRAKGWQRGTPRTGAGPGAWGGLSLHFFNCVNNQREPIVCVASSSPGLFKRQWLTTSGLAGHGRYPADDSLFLGFRIHDAFADVSSERSGCAGSTLGLCRRPTATRRARRAERWRG